MEVLGRALELHGSAPAIRQGGATLGFDQLQDAVARRIAMLDAIGAQRVALALDNRLDWIVWDLALLFSGRVCVPLPAAFAPALQRRALDAAGVDTLVGAPRALALLAGVCGFERRCDGDPEAGVWQRRPARRACLPDGTVKVAFDCAALGRSGGVCLDAEVQLAAAYDVLAASTGWATGRHLCALPLSTPAENVAGVYARLLAGDCVELRPLEQLGHRAAQALDVERFVGCLRQSRPHSLLLLSPMLQALVVAAERGLAPPDSLGFVGICDEPVDAQLLARAHALGLPVFEGHGLADVVRAAPALARPVGRADARRRLAISGAPSAGGRRAGGTIA